MCVHGPFLHAQADDINLSASFSNSIACTVTYGQDINFVVATIGEYRGGLSSPFDYFSYFTVSSSANFKVELSSTDFTDPNGNVLDARNFGFRISNEGTHRPGVNQLLMGAARTPSKLVLLGEDREIVKSSGQGNAGSAEANRYKLQFELGTPSVRALSGLPTLLEQNIRPTTYRAVITLTATAMPF